MNTDCLNEVRAKINDVDQQLMTLFKERMLLSEEVARIKKENNLTSNTINRGQKLQITVYKKVLADDNNSSKKSESSTKRVESPKKGKDTKADKRRERTKKETKAKSHTVKSGESLDRIARKYGVSVNELKKANNIKKNDNTIHPGDKIKIPSKKSKSSSEKKSKSKKSSKKKR